MSMRVTTNSYLYYFRGTPLFIGKIFHQALFSISGTVSGKAQGLFNISGSMSQKHQTLFQVSGDVSQKHQTLFDVYNVDEITH